MGIFIDIVLVVLLIVAVVLSAKKGIMVTVLEIVAFVLAVYLASVACAPVSSAMYNGLFEKQVEKKLYDVIPENPSALTYTQKAEKALEGMPDFAKNYAEKVGINVSSISEKLSQSGIPDNDQLYIAINDKIIEPVAVAVLKNIMFFVLAIVFAAVLKAIAKAISNTLKKSDALGSLDSIVGGALGILKGLVIVFFVCCLLTYLQPKLSENISQGISDSAIVQAADKFDPMEAITAAGVFINNN